MPRLIVVGCRVQGAHGPFIQTNDPVQGSIPMEGRQRRPRRKRLVILGTVIAHLGDRWVVRWDDDAMSITDYRASTLKFLTQTANPPLSDEQRQAYMGRFRPSGETQPARTMAAPPAPRVPTAAPPPPTVAPLPPTVAPPASLPAADSTTADPTTNQGNLPATTPPIAPAAATPTTGNPLPPAEPQERIPTQEWFASAKGGRYWRLGVWMMRLSWSVAGWSVSSFYSKDTTHNYHLAHFFFDDHKSLNHFITIFAKQKE